MKFQILPWTKSKVLVFFVVFLHTALCKRKPSDFAKCARISAYCVVQTLYYVTHLFADGIHACDESHSRDGFDFFFWIESFMRATKRTLKKIIQWSGWKVAFIFFEGRWKQPWPIFNVLHMRAFCTVFMYWYNEMKVRKVQCKFMQLFF